MTELTAERFDTGDNALTTDEREVSAYLWTSVLLTGLLVVCVPVVAAVVELPTALLVVAAGLCYLAAVLVAGRAFEGLTSAVFVLALFDIAVTLVEGPGIATIDLVAVDVVAVPLLLVLCYEALDDGISIRLDGLVTIFGFTAFVCWTFLAGIVANGVSQAAGLMFAIEQFRYLVIFIVTLLVVREKNAWCAVYPFVVAVAGNLLVSLAQIVNGGMLGFPFMGEPPDRYLGAFRLFGFEIATGFYAGGFVGHGRELAMVLFMFIPLVVAVSLRHSWAHVLGAVVAVAASVLSIRVADTDAGWGTLILLSALFGTYLFVASLVWVKRRYSTVGTVPILAGALAGGFVLVRGIQAIIQPNDGGIPLLRTNTLAVRLEEYVTAVNVALEYPLFGIGGNNFYLISERFGLPADIGVHNTLLSHLAGTGFVGLFFYLLAVLTVLFVAARLALRTSGTERLLWVAMFCAMVAFHAYSSWMASYHWTVGNSAFWLLCGITVGAVGERSSGSAQSGNLL